MDYLQLMSGGGRRYENRTQEVSAISRGLKALAKELKVPVVALSQLSRAPESRGGDHRPQLADLRESGSIEQDADVVAFIFREEVYKPDEPELEGRAELIIAKQRNGPTGKVKLAFVKRSTRFESMAQDGMGPPGVGDFPAHFLTTTLLPHPVESLWKRRALPFSLVRRRPPISTFSTKRRAPVTRMNADI